MPRPPRATYRLQLRNGVTFQSARTLVPYLDDLGIADLYLSPIFTARSGSTHGYDIVDPTRVDPTLGTEDDLVALADTLRAAEMGLLIDIVPNHLSTSTENRWWRDVLQNGPDSRSAAFFDIDWAPAHHPELAGKVLLPMLGGPLDDVVARGELKIAPVKTGDSEREPVLRYFDHELPLAPGTDPDGSMHEVLAGQHYVLEHWRAGARRVNWRRFFGLSELVGVRVEDPEVFSATHALVGRLVCQGIVTGLRVDHVDGLRDPQGYLERLQALCGGDGPGGHFPVIVEKILHHDEDLPDEWPVLGTTGYDFTGAVNGIFVDPNGFSDLQAFFAAFSGERRTYSEVVEDSKRHVLDELLPSDLDRVAARRAGDPIDDCDAVRETTVDDTVSLGVYRTYQRGPDAAGWVLDWQQLTGSVTAKAVEDTAYYVYVPLVSVNEVGGGPDALSADPVRALHELSERRLRQWPHGLSATATHDTKRGEDARLRIDVLSEMPREWARAVDGWRRIAERHKGEVDGEPAPDGVDELLMYQTLVGSWPVEGPNDDFAERVTGYVVKAAREAKRRTSWHDVDEAYELALVGLADGLLGDREFLDDVAPFARRLGWHGMLNGLSQVVLKVASPGVPDVYQGAETWDLSLVDPDNRRPVDFELRGQMLRDLDEATEIDLGGLLDEWRDGRIKLAVTARALRARRADTQLFDTGEYLPLAVSEERSDNVVAFARHAGDRWALAVVPRLTTRLGTIGVPPVGTRRWSGATLTLPETAPTAWSDVVTGRVVGATATGRALSLAEVLHDLPVALLVSHRRD